MKILHIVAGVWRTSGGIAELILGLTRQQVRDGHQVTLAFLEQSGDSRTCRHPDVLVAEKENVHVETFRPSWPSALYFSWGMLFKLSRLVEAAEVVHVHGNWTFPVWWGCRQALRWRKVLVMTPHGCLEPERLKRSAIKKWMAGRFFDRRYLRDADCIHATSEMEARGVRTYVRDIPGAEAKTVVVPAGLFASDFAHGEGRFWVDQRWPACEGKRVMLFLSRIDPIKGADLLVDAWHQLGSATEGWHLLIAGPDEKGAEGTLRRQVDKAGLCNCVTFAGALVGKDRIAALRNADVFVLPTRNDNFGIVVAEAMASGVPVITTKGAPWSELLGGWGCVSSKPLMVNSEPLSRNSPLLFDGQNDKDQQLTINRSPFTEYTANGRCGWWVDIGVEPLAKALREAMGLSDEERHAMGENGRRLVESKYTWETVAAKMVEMYSRVAG